MGYPYPSTVESSMDFGIRLQGPGLDLRKRSVFFRGFGFGV